MRYLEREQTTPQSISVHDISPAQIISEEKKSVRGTGGKRMVSIKCDTRTFKKNDYCTPAWLSG